MLALALAVLAAGCGASDEPASVATAEVAPASAAAYASVQADLDAGQWDQVAELIRRFPDGEQASPRQLFEREGVDYERDVAPALGPTVELVWLDFEDEGENVVALTQPEDVAKLRALAQEADEPTVVGEVEGWSAVARSQAVIDRYREALAAGTLADDDGFRSAQEELPAEALASVYVDGERARDALESAAGSAEDWSTYPGLGRVLGGAAALEADDDGFRLTGYLRADEVAPDVTAVGELLDEIPAGAFLALDFRAPSAETKADPRLGELERRSGLPLSALASVLQGEVVLYVRPGPVIPEITLLSAPPDAAAAKARLEEALASLPFLGAAERRQTTVDGVPASVLDFGRFALVYAAVGDRLVVTTLPDAIRTLREDGDKLVDDGRYGDALEAAGVEDGEDVVAYADFEQALRLLEGLSALGGEGGVPPEAARNLAPLRSLVASTASDGGELTYRLFVEIEG